MSIHYSDTQTIFFFPCFFFPSLVLSSQKPSFRLFTSPFRRFLPSFFPSLSFLPTQHNPSLPNTNSLCYPKPLHSRSLNLPRQSLPPLRYSSHELSSPDKIDRPPGNRRDFGNDNYTPPPIPQSFKPKKKIQIKNANT